MKLTTVTIISSFCIIGFLGCGINNGPSLLDSSTIATKPLVFSNGQDASVVIGQNTFVTDSSGTSATKLNYPWGNPDVHDGVLYIMDYFNRRVLGYNTIPTSNGAAADFVIGQADFNSRVATTSATGLFDPWALSIGGETLAIADTSNNRVLFYIPVPSSSSPSANVVLGQNDFSSSSFSCSSTGLSSPSAVKLVGNRVLVADYQNHRILIWNTVPTNNLAPADLVLGQPNFDTCGVNEGGLSSRSLQSPGDVWSDGEKVIVADSSNHRLLIWTSFPTTNYQPADLVLGQTDFVSNIANKGGAISASGFDSGSDQWSSVSSNGIQIFYSDYGNNRILVWNSYPDSNGLDADIVLGQSNFISGGALNPPSASSLNGVGGISVHQSQFFITDYGNNRILIFDSN